jgi:hypothetical protein
VVESRGEVATFPPRRLLALRRSGSGKPDTSSLPRIRKPRQDVDGATAAIDRWRRGSPGPVKVAHLLAATDTAVCRTASTPRRHCRTQPRSATDAAREGGHRHVAGKQ